MKILVTCDPEIPVPPGKYGGVERLVSGLCQEYQKLGHEVFLIANSASTESVNKLFSWKVQQSRGIKSIINNGFKLLKVVKEIKPDVIHSFSRLLYLYPLAIARNQIPVLQTYGRAISTKSTNLASKIYGNKLHFACCGKHMLKNIPNQENWNVVYNFTDTNFFRLSNANERKYLVFLGRIEDIKGTHEAIEVAIKSNTPLVIAGNVEKEHQDYFDRKVKPFIDGDFIKYIGPVNDEQKQQLFNKAKAFLMPIKWEEPFGIVMIEAMACGIPVIAFNRGSVPEIVQPGTGLIARDIEEMAKYVSVINKLDPYKIRDYVIMNFSKHVIANKYLSIFDKIISE